MPKGIKGFQKGHKSFWTEESKKKAQENSPRYWFGKKRDNPEYLEKISLAHKGQHSSPATEFKNVGNRAYKVVGDENAYRNLHKFIEKQLGKPNTCQHCGKSNLSGKLIHWANKSGLYLRDLSDWLRLCVRCHYYHDINKYKF